MIGLLIILFVFGATIGGLLLWLAPKISGVGAAGLTGFLDRQEWTPAEEEIGLRSVRRLIDADRFREALTELEVLLKKHPPTYEALMIRAKLLYHFGRIEETGATLVKLIGLSKTTEQQLAVMELLAVLEGLQPPATRPAAAGRRRFRITHELVLFPSSGTGRSVHRAIPPGDYEVEETAHDKHIWLKLAGEDWGNAVICWQAARAMARPSAAQAGKGFFTWWAGLGAGASEGKGRIHAHMEARGLLKEANALIRNGDWAGAAPLLERASAGDPEQFEIAHRWAQAIRRTADDTTRTRAVAKILKQSRWTPHEQEMLRQLQRPLPGEG